MGCNIRAQNQVNNANTIEYFIDTSMPDYQVICAAAIPVTPGTTTIYTHPNGAPPLLVLQNVIWNRVASGGTPAGVLQVNGVTALNANPSTTVDVVNINSGGNGAILRPNQTIAVNLTAGTTGLIVIQVTGIVLPAI